ncbi:MAG: methionyl-tRNA formyltransferase [Planctomycetota bacterium]
MRLVLMGTGPCGAPTFRRLYDTHHEIAALVTAPVKQRGGRPPAASPVRQLAGEHGTPILDPDQVNGEEARARLAEYGADLLVVCDYGQILSAQTLATTRLGGVNLHGSLLPKYRGAAPIHWAIYHGEPETGVSVIHMTPRVDAGPVIGQSRTPIGPDETAADVEARLSQMGAAPVLRAIDALEAGAERALPQNPALASKAPRLKKIDGVIDWARPAEAIRNHVRAMEPWPKTYTFWHRAKGPRVRLILGPVSLAEAPAAATPGTVLEASGDRIVVAAGEGAVVLETLQPAGKRLLEVREFLRGNPVRPGDCFGPE